MWCLYDAINLINMVLILYSVGTGMLGTIHYLRFLLGAGTQIFKGAYTPI